MSCLIKRTTTMEGQDTVFYFVRMTVLGPMFNLRNMATVFESREEAQEMIDENLSGLEGVIEIVDL